MAAEPECSAEDSTALTDSIARQTTGAGALKASKPDTGWKTSSQQALAALTDEIISIIRLSQ